jgi:hypothetical protein
LALIASDDLIAGLLNRWTRERVTSLRSHHRIPVFKTADDGVEPWLNLSDAARLLTGGFTAGREYREDWPELTADWHERARRV